MTRAWPYIPGVPAAGHITGGGFWHPGRIEGCTKCETARPSTRGANLVSTTIVIGWTKSDRDAGYVSMMDGYRPGADQHVLSITVDLPPRLEPHRVAELVFIATNAPELDPASPEGAILHAIQATGYRGREAHFSLSVGDTVTVAGTKLACQAAGWTPVTGWNDAKAARYGELEDKRKGLSETEGEAWAGTAESKELEALAVERWDHLREHPTT